MKSEKRLIIKILNSLSAKHPDMSFTYGFDAFFQEHIVEVQPPEKYEDNDYIFDEGKAMTEFIASFPDKGLAFVSNDLFLKVENPIYQTKAKSTKSLFKNNALPSKSFWGNLSRTLGF